MREGSRGHCSIHNLVDIDIDVVVVVVVVVVAIRVCMMNSSIGHYHGTGTKVSPW
jgi:hypothetical protein